MASTCEKKSMKKPINKETKNKIPPFKCLNFLSSLFLISTQGLLYACQENTKDTYGKHVATMNMMTKVPISRSYFLLLFIFLYNDFLIFGTYIFVKRTKDV